MATHKNPNNIDNIEQAGENETSKGTELFTEEEISEMKKKAVECRVPMGGGADETIQYFLDYIKEGTYGKNCYCELNGRKVYSIDLLNISQSHGCDLENAFYLQFYGKTKSQVEMERAKMRQEKEAEKKRKKMEAIEKIPGWIEEGKKYIDKSKWGDWEKYVDASARDMYHGGDIDDTLRLLKLIEEGRPWEEIQKIFDENCGVGFYHSIVGNRVIYFSKKGEDVNRELKVRNG